MPRRSRVKSTWPTWHSCAKSLKNLNSQQLVNRIIFFSNGDPAAWAAQESFVFMWMMVAGLVQCYLAGTSVSSLVSIPKEKGLMSSLLLVHGHVVGVCGVVSCRRDQRDSQQLCAPWLDSVSGSETHKIWCE